MSLDSLYAHVMQKLFKVKRAFCIIDRCIRPNEQMIAGRFDQEKVQTQLRYTGVLETTRIRQQVGSSVNLRFDVISFMRLTFLYLKLF